MRSPGPLLLVLLLAAGAFFLFSPEITTTPADHPVLHRDAITPAQAPSGGRTADLARTPVAETPLPVTWTVQLTGLDPALPWHARLWLGGSGMEPGKHRLLSFRGSAEVAADGTARFAAPEWVARVENLLGMCSGDEPDYVPIAIAFDDALRTSGVLTIAVQPCAVLTGRVLASRGEIKRASVAAFALRDGAPCDPRLATCETAAGERFTLRVPANVPLVVIATATQTFDPHWAAMQHLIESVRGNAPAFDHSVRWTGFVPMAVRAEGRVHEPQVLPDIRLAEQALATGVVLREGQPVVGSRITCRAASAVATFGEGFQWLADGTVVMAATMNTDDRGAFLLPGPAGVPMQLVVTIGTPREPREVIVGLLLLPATTTVTLP